jgi:hypothetical protein
MTELFPETVSTLEKYFTHRILGLSVYLLSQFLSQHLSFMIQRKCVAHSYDGQCYLEQESTDYGLEKAPYLRF